MWSNPIRRSEKRFVVVGSSRQRRPHDDAGKTDGESESVVESLHIESQDI
jgi:hypothetical protein